MTKTKFGTDRVLAAAVGIAAFVLMCVWPFNGIHPYVWDDVAIAAGLVPQGRMLPGLGVYLSHLTFVALPYGMALWLNGVLAKLAIALCGAMAFSIFRGMMDLASGNGAQDIRRRTLAGRISAFVAAFMFACSEPAWQASHGLSGSGFVILLTVVSARFYISFLRRPSLLSTIAALFAAGLLCAETPLGWFVVAFFVLVTIRYLANNKTQEWTDFLDPVVMQKTKWSMTFVFLGVVIVGMLLESFAFAMLDGMKASGSTFGDLPVLYVKAYFRSATGAFGLIGGCLFLVTVLVPFILSLIVVTPSTDEERYLSFKYSIVYFGCGLLAFLQLSPFSLGWFWNVVEHTTVSKVMMLFGVLLSAVTLAWALFVLLVEVLCRDYKRIERMLYQSYQDDEDDRPVPARQEDEVKEEADDTVEKSVKLGALRLSILLVPLAMVVIVVNGRRLPEDRQLQDMLCDYINETIEEAAGSKYIFTDGAFDSWLRIEARRRGIGLLPISVMSGSSSREAYIRRIGTEGEEDRITLETGAAETLRTWIVSKSERISDVSVQVAFELFRLNRRLEPLVYGLLIRPKGGDAAAAEASVERCHALSDRIVAAHESGVWRHAKDRFLKDRFLFVQFRLAVMSRLRAINLDVKKKVKESIAEISYSDRLNMNNPSLVKILRRMDWIRRQNGESLTPREGLEIAVKRADFMMARRYAMPVLREDPDDPRANFAMGMSYYVEEQFAKAEEYLRRVLKKNPDEPAVYNNIALICLKTGRLEEAETNALHALKIRPDLLEIKDTVRQVEKTKEERKRKF